MCDQVFSQITLDCLKTNIPENGKAISLLPMFLATLLAVNYLERVYAFIERFMSSSIKKYFALHFICECKFFISQRKRNNLYQWRLYVLMALKPRLATAWRG